MSQAQPQERVQLGIYIRWDLKKRAMKYAIDRGMKLYEVVEEALEEYLKRRGA